MSQVPQPTWTPTTVPATLFSIQPQVGHTVTIEVGFGFGGFGAGGFDAMQIVSLGIQPVWTQVQSQFGPYGVGVYGERDYGIGETYWTPEITK